MTAVPLSSMNHKNQSKITEKNMWEVYFPSYCLQPGTLPKMSSITDKLQQFC